MYVFKLHRTAKIYYAFAPPSSVNLLRNIVIKIRLRYLSSSRRNENRFRRPFIFVRHYVIQNFFECVSRKLRRSHCKCRVNISIYINNDDWTHAFLDTFTTLNTCIIRGTFLKDDMVSLLRCGNQTVIRNYMPLQETKTAFKCKIKNVNKFYKNYLPWAVKIIRCQMMLIKLKVSLTEILMMIYIRN